MERRLTGVRRSKRSELKIRLSIKTKMIWQYTGPEGRKVDFSSDTLSGFLTTKQLEEARARGAAPSGRGGYFNWYGPDGVVMETTDSGTEGYTIVGMFQEQPYCAAFWYRKHLSASDRPAGGGRGGGWWRWPWRGGCGRWRRRGGSRRRGGGRGAAGAGGGGGAAGPGGGGGGGGRGGAAAPTEANCQVTRGRDVSWPSTYKNGHYRDPAAQAVYFGDVTLRWYMNQENRPLAPTRGQLMDHVAIAVSNLDELLAKLRSDGVTILAQPYKFGDARAALIEGPSREAIELVENK